MEDIDSIIRAIDKRIIEEEKDLMAHNLCLKCNVSKKVISISSLGAFLSTVYFVFTEKNLMALISKQAMLVLIWTLVVLIPFALVLMSTRRCNRVKKMLVKRSVINDWLKTKTLEQQQSILVIMRSRRTNY